MPSTVVVGLQWGDEGKGKVVDYLAAQVDVVARFSGGANASHTVEVDNHRLHLSLVPSAALQTNTVLVLADGVAINPAILAEEIENLVSGYGFQPDRLLIAQNAIVTFSYHLFLDQSTENIGGNAARGTTRMGHGPTRVDQVARQGVRLHEFLDPRFMQDDLVRRTATGLTQAHLFSSSPGMVYFVPEYYQKVCKLLRPHVTDTALYLNEALDNGQSILFEGSQGALLDLTFGTYPNVSSSSTIAGAACTGTGVGPTRIDRVFGVTKAYTTRLDTGPMPSEIFGPMADWLRQHGNKHMNSPSKPLRVGWLDLVALNYAARLNAISSFAITNLDVLDGLQYVNVCVGYRKGDVIVPRMPADLLNGGYEPVCHQLLGWENSRAVIVPRELPQAAKEYVQFIEEFIGVQCDLISIGPNRTQTIELRDPLAHI